MTTLTHETLVDLKEYLQGSLGLEEEVHIQPGVDGIRIDVPAKSLIEFGVSISAFFVNEEHQGSTDFTDMVSGLLTTLVEIEPIVEEYGAEFAIVFLEASIEAEEEDDEEEFEDELDEDDENGQLPLDFELGEEDEY